MGATGQSRTERSLPTLIQSINLYKDISIVILQAGTRQKMLRRPEYNDTNTLLTRRLPVELHSSARGWGSASRVGPGLCTEPDCMGVIIGGLVSEQHGRRQHADSPRPCAVQSAGDADKSGVCMANQPQAVAPQLLGAKHTEWQLSACSPAPAMLS
ncbi:hypothetical protein B0H10DRAFT_1948675 [Mycena sp. CBHHK59/15]|nr:hypothetical protein B0H10DRAFT_1948675 [Mycena sp. CBHHK59/15]